jgi:hypothetical protein
MVSAPSVTPYWSWGHTPPEYFWGTLGNYSEIGSLATNGQGNFGSIHSPYQGIDELFNVSAQRPYLRGVMQDPSELIAKSFTTMRPGIRSNLSFLNSFYELKDFRSLPRMVAGFQSRLSNFTQSFRRLTTQARKLSKTGKLTLRSFRDVAKSAAESHLANQFAIQPLVGDINAIHGVLSSAREQLNNLLAGANRAHKSHFMAPLGSVYTDDYDETSHVGQASWFCWPIGIRSYRSIKYTARQFNATLEYSYKLPQAGVLGYELSALLDALGVNINPAIIWNAMPWTFVVDWVLAIGKYLDNFQTRNIEPVLYVHRYCYSFKVARVIQTGVILQGTPYHVFEIDEELYFRALADPKAVSTSILSSGLSLKELGLSVALGVSRR